MDTVEADLRSYARIGCRLPAHLTINGKPLADCVIGDISGLGCRIYLGEGRPLPQVFEIHCTVFERPLPARIMWRTPGVVGVRFAVARPLDVPLPPGCTFVA